jgi:hypothetical protein
MTSSGPPLSMCVASLDLAAVSCDRPPPVHVRSPSGSSNRSSWRSGRSSSSTSSFFTAQEGVTPSRTNGPADRVELGVHQLVQWRKQRAVKASFRLQRRSTPPQPELTSPVKRGLSVQRSVNLGTLMGGRARHFRSNKAGEREHALSRSCDEYEYFISHSWRAPRLLKWLALLFRFSLWPALVVTHVACLLALVLVGTRVLPMLDLPWQIKVRPTSVPSDINELVADRTSPWAQMFGLVGFVLTLFGWEHVHGRLERAGLARPTRCFLDKLCICQDDDALRQQVR